MIGFYSIKDLKSLLCNWFVYQCYNSVTQRLFENLLKMFGLANGKVGGEGQDLSDDVTDETLGLR